MVRNFNKYLILSRVASFKPTFTTMAPIRASTQSVRFEVIDENTVKVWYQGIITVASASMQRELHIMHKKDALEMIEAAVKDFAERYKETVKNLKPEDAEVSGATESTLTPDKGTIKLTLKDFTISDSVEFIDYSVYKPFQTAFYRVSALIDVK